MKFLLGLVLKNEKKKKLVWFHSKYYFFFFNVYYIITNEGENRLDFMRWLVLIADVIKSLLIRYTYSCVYIIQWLYYCYTAQRAQHIYIERESFEALHVDYYILGHASLLLPLRKFSLSFKKNRVSFLLPYYTMNSSFIATLSLRSKLMMKKWRTLKIIMKMSAPFFVELWCGWDVTSEWLVG
jgi:hypothetical protein